MKKRFTDEQIIAMLKEQVAGQLHQPFLDLGILVAQLALIPVAAFADTERPTGQRNADAAVRDRLQNLPMKL